MTKSETTPLAYVIAEVEIIDQEAFVQFASRSAAAMLPYTGRYLTRGGKVAAIDGDTPKRVVVSVFDSFEKALAWRDSEEWEALRALRTKATNMRSYIVEGVSE